MTVPISMWTTASWIPVPAQVQVLLSAVLPQQQMLLLPRMLPPILPPILPQIPLPILPQTRLQILLRILPRILPQTRLQILLRTAEFNCGKPGYTKNQMLPCAFCTEQRIQEAYMDALPLEIERKYLIRYPDLEELKRRSAALDEWQQSPWLQGELVLLLDQDNATTLNGYCLTYDRETGLHCTKEDHDV